MPSFPHARPATPAELLRHHYAHLSDAAEERMDALAAEGEDFPFARECDCGVMLEGSYEYLDHLLAVLAGRLEPVEGAHRLAALEEDPEPPDDRLVLVAGVLYDADNGWERRAAAPDDWTPVCPVCGLIRPQDTHPCRFVTGCSCWRGLPCRADGDPRD